MSKVPVQGECKGLVEALKVKAILPFSPLLQLLRMALCFQPGVHSQMHNALGVKSTVSQDSKIILI